MNNLGGMYVNDRGVGQDYREAVNWLRKAAAEGYAAAMSNLGNMYSDGRGVGQDDGEAGKWWWKAARQGDTDAQDALRKLNKSW